MSISTLRIRAGLLVLAGLQLSIGSTSPAETAGTSDASIRERFEKADLRIDPAKDCAADKSLPSAEATRLAIDLSTAVAPLLHEEPNADVRKRIALQATGQSILQRGRSENGSFHLVLKKLSSGRADDALSALDDLRKSVLTTAQMRSARAAIADVVVVDGQVMPVLRGGSLPGELFDVVSPVVWRALEQTRREGLDCSSTPYYRFFQGAPQDMTENSYAAIKQGDLQKLYDQAVKLSEDYSSKLEAAQKSGKASEKTDIKPVMDLYSEIQALHTKAMRVLSAAIEKHETFLMAMPERAPKKAPPVEPTPAPTPAPQPVAAKTGNGTGATAVVVVKDEKKLREEAIEAKRSALVSTVNRQAEVLRGQRGLVSTAPVGVANNLLTRLKKVAQVADMLVEAAPDERYECSMSEDRIHVRYAKARGDLKTIRIDVTERFEQDVLLSWYITLDRQDDANFKIASEFNEVQASMEVQQSELKRYPNYHQLMVLMNRLSEIMDKK